MRPKMCGQKLHICMIYDIHSHYIMKFTLLYCFVSELIGRDPQRASRKLSSLKSVVWEHSEKKVICEQM